MSWTVLAAVRRLGRPDSGPASAATVSTSQILRPTAAAKTSFFSKLFNKTPTASPTQSGQSATGVIAGNLNAVDRDGDSLTFTVATGPAHGTVQLDPAGGFTYTPDKSAAHNGITDQFAITVSDEASGSHRHGFLGKNRHTVTSTITVTVTPVNVAPTATPTIGTPDPGTGVVTGAVIAADDDGDPLTYPGSVSTDKGAVVVGGDGSFTYTPTVAARHAAANLSATAADKVDSFTLTVSDGRGASTAVPVNVLISPANAAPTATTSVGTPDGQTGAVTGQVAGADADADPLSYTGSTTTAKGAVVVDENGAFTYTPTAGARHNAAALSATAADKIDLFTVTISDGFGGSTVVPVTVTVSPVNAAPTATVDIAEPNPVTGVVLGVVAGRDADGDSLTYAGATTSKGTAVVGSGGQITYTPTVAARRSAAASTATAAEKADTFTVTISDGHGGSVDVPVTVTISPLNTAPTGTANSGTPDPTTGVVAGAVIGADADGDSLTYSGSTTTAKGAVVVAGGGGFAYTPTGAARHAAAASTATAAEKSDTFTVTISDGHGGTVDIPVTVAVSPFNTAPTAIANAGTPDPVTGVVAGSVIGADADGDSLTYAGATTSKGTAVVGPGGQITYTPNGTARHAAAAPTATAADKTDTFTITVSDGHGGSVAIPVKVAVAPGNTAPTGTTNSGTPDPTTGVVAGAVIGADTDGDSLTYTGSTTTAKGTVVVTGGGGFTYTPIASARHRAAALTATAADKTDTFTVTISDGYGGSVAVPVTVAISPLNTAPVVSASVGMPNPSTGVVTGSVAASDADRDPLSYSGAVTAKGTAVVSANGTITYTPTSAARHAAANLTATAADKSDTFTITVSDGHGGSTATPVTVSILGANAAPTGTSSAGVPDAVSGVVAGAVLGVDLDRDTLSYSGSGATAKGAVVVGADGSFTFTPTALARHVAGLPGATQSDTTDTFVVAVADGYGGTVNVPVTVTVSPASITFNFVYGTGSQYWTPEARAALNTAATRLASSIVVAKPVTLTYEVVGDNNVGSGWIGTSLAKFTSNSPGFYGTVVQTNIITGTDANGSATDSQIGMNFAYPWALGNTVPNNQYDFQSVATHELVHTLGIMTGLSSPTSNDRNWTTYDRYLSTADGTAVIGANYVWNATYTPNLTGGNGGLYFNGSNAVAVYGGPVPLYTPGTWTSGSSVSHLDRADAPPGVTYLMDPSDGYGLGVRTPTAVELAMLEDLGYTVYQPGSYAVFFVGFFLRRRRRN